MTPTVTRPKHGLRDVPYLDGRRLAAWLKAHGIAARDVESSGSIMSSWERGRSLSLYTADLYLTRLGYHLSELPDECWIDSEVTA